MTWASKNLRRKENTEREPDPAADVGLTDL
jgi:hypothetical protein